MNTAFERLRQHLNERQIGYSIGADNESIVGNLVGQASDYRLVIRVLHEADLFQVSGHLPTRVPLGARLAIAEVITRANLDLRIGKFTLDFESGEVKFQIDQILTDSLDVDLVDWLICRAVAALDKYLPAILSVIYSDEAPADAVRRTNAIYRLEQTQESEFRGDPD